ncbi:MAG TPA: hydantoinase B/oxoprolinase family protein [Acidimicrobiales bacterium]|nr:hydantoinase B/oxoprolinase family protein [Acidimicrobiales bacterium]
MSRLDDVLRFETLRNELQTVADEIAVRLARSSFSPVIRDYLDFSTALCDRDGRLVAQGFSLPLHLGSIPRALEAVRARFGDGLDPGDLVVLNDPYAGGMHLPDVFAVAPAHLRGRLVGYAVVVAHHADVGGRVPGGSAADSREIFEEGIRVPPVRLSERGRTNEALAAVLAANVRLPETLLADLDAQRASCEAAAGELACLVERVGPAAFDEAVEAILAHSRRSLEATIATWPAGRYEFEDVEDHDGLEERPVPIRVLVEVGDGRLRFDFSGTAPQVRGSINATRSFTESACYAAVRALCAEEIPVNAGFCSLIEVEAPPGTVVNASFPAGVAARGVIGYRVIEAIFGALADALPGRVPAAGDGGTSGIRIGGYTADGRRFQLNDLVCGAWGARPDRDGLDGAAALAANVANRPVEVLEREDPVRVLHYGFVPDTGGPGRFRGGLALRRTLELLAPAGTLNLRTHRNATPPYGLSGGHSGSTSRTVLYRRGGARELPAKVTMPLEAGDVIEHTTASGGGFGDPRQRAREAVLADVADGKVSPEAARLVYGLDDPRPDGRDSREGA